MHENPFQAPTTETTANESIITGINSGSHKDLLAVAKYQKYILGCILLYLLLAVSQIAAPPEISLLIGLSILVLCVVGTVLVFLLAMKVYSTAVGILFAVLTLVPCIGLLMLLLINGKATRILKQNGIRVGLLGAKLSDVENMQT